MTGSKTTSSDSSYSTQKTLIFGANLSAQVSAGVDLSMGEAIVGDCRKVSGTALAELAVVRVVCSLFAPQGEAHHDAVSVIEALADAGFRGEVIVLAPPLLRPKMVETELRSLALAMRLRLLPSALPPLTAI